MENNHLTYFKIENFKKFDSLEVNDIGQFNLIVGDNNVGKTCLLEALLIDEDIDKCIENLHNTLCKRNLHLHPKRINSKNPIFPDKNYFDYLKNNVSNKFITINWKNDNSSFNFKFEDKKIEELTELDFEKEVKNNYDIGRPNLWIKTYINDEFNNLQFMYLDDFRTKFSHGYQPFISKDAGFNVDVNRYYAEEIGLGENESISSDLDDDFINFKIKSLSYNDQQDFIKTLSIFFEDIENVMLKSYFNRDILSLKLKRNEDYLPITYFGDGVNQYIRYILEIYKCKNNPIMIDEIATGVHYSKMENFWINIFKICRELEVQLFATTHSQECTEAYVNASATLNITSDIRLIKLEESSNKEKIYASTFTHNQISAGLDSNVELRG
ncbi:AAA family ATPase [Flavobacterium sp. GA093]|uniref:AAA family ATPase n=1 Tax=Flavobacterium hydrocarbonoxydans TaxID=2683249 RepID=A0A6I4NW70_9FLAO|nr:AAA family ATPase [Flavobacterium hydrocarbonoxydans]MWB95899.1 AAA family ATPase [Flavobacterium hydrocarbonoxydans]